MGNLGSHVHYTDLSSSLNLLPRPPPRTLAYVLPLKLSSCSVLNLIICLLVVEHWTFLNSFEIWRGPACGTFSASPLPYYKQQSLALYKVLYLGESHRAFYSMDVYGMDGVGVERFVFGKKETQTTGDDGELNFLLSPKCVFLFTSPSSSSLSPSPVR